MACNLTKDEMSELILRVIRNIRDDQTIGLETQWNRIATGVAKRRYFRPIKETIAARAAGCAPKKIGPGALTSAATVQDTVDVFWNARQ